MHENFRVSYQEYLEACRLFGKTQALSGSLLTHYAILEDDDDFLYALIDTGGINCGRPFNLMRFDELRFFGEGTLSIRSMVDGVEVTRSEVTLAEGPRGARRFVMPTGAAGYEVSFQIGGLGEWRYFDLAWDLVRSEG